MSKMCTTLTTSQSLLPDLVSLRQELLVLLLIQRVHLAVRGVLRALR